MNKTHNSDNTQLLKNENINKLLIKFSIPAIVGMLVNALYNIVDRIFVGRYVGNIGIGAIFVSSTMTLILMAFAMLVGIGGNSLSSIRLGEGKKEDSEKILAHVLILAFIISTILAILGFIFLEPLLLFFGSSRKILPYSVEYTRIILLGAPLQAIGFAVNHFIRGEGNPTTAMFTMLIGAISNVVLDYIFIAIFHMGIAGAAWATIISQGISMIWVLYYFINGDSYLKLKKENLKLKFETVKEIFSLGFAQFSMHLATSLVNIFLANSLAKYGGDLALSSMGVISSLNMLMMMPMFGINQGAQPIIGFNYGAKQYKRVRETLKKAILAATLIAIVGFVLVRTIPDKLFYIFLDKKDNIDEIMSVGVRGLQIYLLMLPIIGIQVVSSNYFQATGKPIKATLLGLSRQVLILIPAILILPNFFGLDGVWGAAVVSDFLSTFIAIIFLVKDLKLMPDRI